MLARYLKAQFWVLLCGGATGPVFVALYFALPSLFGSEVSSYDTSMSSTVSSLTQQSIQWMLWVGLLITAGAVLVALWLANRGAKSSAKSAALHQTGVLTMAQITGLGETGMRINDRPVVNLDLHIAGPGVRVRHPKAGYRRHHQAGHRYGAQARSFGGPEHA